jgi:hypothetical protein
MTLIDMDLLPWHAFCFYHRADWYIPLLTQPLKEHIMMKSKLLNSLILTALAAPGLAMAADAPAAPTLSSVLDASGVSITGDIDFSYSHLSSTGTFTSGVNNRVFDYSPNSFSVQQVDLAVAKLPAEGFGGMVETTLGKDASTIASYGTQTAAPSPTASGMQTFDLTQAFGQYATGNWTTIFGKFNTMAGAEVIKAAGNTNFSRSILFGYAIPFTHTGVRTTYKVSDAVSLVGGVNNGWDQAQDSNAQKTVELAAVMNPSKSFALTADVYSGAEPASYTPGAAMGNRTLLDLVATFTATDSLNFVLNYDNGSQKNAVATGTAKWSGLAAYMNYQINDPWRVSVRAETFKDADGFRTGVVQTWKEATVTVGYAVSKNTELRGEVRKDVSDVASFAYSDGIARKGQNSLAMEAVYKF